MGADTRKIIIIAAPSGSGKTSITRYLLQQHPLLSLSISAATRKPRGEEKDGVHYHFISEAEFKQRIEENAFVEWEMVYEGSYYGTLKAELERIWNLGKIPILDIDVKGAIHLQDQFPNRCLSIFIEPPSVEELKKRLESRGTETPESLANRVNKASYELSFKSHFHKNILNDNLEKACKETEEVIKEFLGW
ncbi:MULTISPECIES: guanylate kinase [Sediminibacterium]|uniref:guanylate kinase n=1 Tax=Sediminibacterium TaxID=504481 RepID=UPI000408F779|nr:MULTISPECIES: guanylate kinase [Sediminibacterium]